LQSEKYQKNNYYPSYNDIDNFHIYYIEDSLATMTCTLPQGDTIIREAPWGVGTVEFYSNGKFKKAHCEKNGTTCGYATYMRGTVVLATGIWAVYEDPCDGSFKYYYTWD